MIHYPCQTILQIQSLLYSEQSKHPKKVSLLLPQNDSSSARASVAHSSITTMEVVVKNLLAPDDNFTDLPNCLSYIFWAKISIPERLCYSLMKVSCQHQVQTRVPPIRFVAYRAPDGAAKAEPFLPWALRPSVPNAAPSASHWTSSKTRQLSERSAGADTFWVLVEDYLAIYARKKRSQEETEAGLAGNDNDPDLTVPANYGLHENQPPYRSATQRALEHQALASRFRVRADRC
jgi:phage tail protein X